MVNKTVMLVVETLIALALFPAVQAGIDAINTSSATLNALLDLVPFLYIAVVVVGLVAQFRSR